ncbi:MAG: YncE family protein, partial [Candidatus Thioglobus sp.]|nr:YncE family protein [Candidatus Thioglobus sp.]
MNPVFIIAIASVAMVGVMVPSVFADTESELTTSVVTESIVNVLDIKADNVAIDEINSRVFLSFTYSNEITVIDSKTDEIIDKLTVGGNAIQAIAVNPTTERLFVSYEVGRDGYIQIFNSKTLEPELFPLPIQRYPFDIAVNDSGNRLYVAENESSNLLIFEISENEIRLLETINTPKWTIGVTIDEIKRIVSVSGASIQINDLDDYSHVSTISIKGQPFGTAIDPKLNQLYSINSNPDYFSIIDLNTNNVIKNISTGFYPYGVAVNPETHRIYVSTQTSIEIFDGITNSKIHTFEVQNGEGTNDIKIDKNLQKAYVAKYLKTYVIDLECNCPEFFENYLNEIQEEENIKKEQQEIENQIYQIKQDWEHRTLLIFSEPPSQSQMLQLIGTEKKAKYEKLVLDLQSRNIQLSNLEDSLNSNQITSDERRLMLEMLEDFIFVLKTYFKDKVT